VVGVTGATLTSGRGKREKRVTFTEAIKSGFDHYVKFDGRASRPAYWWWFLFGILVWAGAWIIDAALGTQGVLGGLAGLALLLPGLSVSIRRLHDTDHTGWWVLIGLIPIIGFIVLLVFYLREGDAGENKYGPPPVETAVPANA
jgi:uncharacterized membrane protein YhaH (DUF805 family)